MENITKNEVSENKNAEKFIFKISIKKEYVYVILLFALVNWISHYLYFNRFGLYEDDYSNIPEIFDHNLQGLIQYTTSRLTYWIQGHPLLFMPGLFTYIGKEISNGLAILYVIAFIIITINSFLLYKILKKIFPDSTLFAISGTLIFCLFPPETTKLYLIHAYFLHMSIMFFFIATLLYLNGWKRISYALILLCLLSYESPFMLFFGVPLLIGKWDKKFRKDYIYHILILCLMIILVLLYRKVTGESRAIEATSDLFGVLTKVLAALFIGPLFNIFLFLRAPIVTIKYLISSSPLYWWYYDYIYYILTGCFLFFLILFSKIKSDYNNNNVAITISGTENNNLNLNDNIFNEYFKKILKIFIAAIILLCLAYSVSFTHFPPIAMMGRDSSVHLAANFGGSIIFACICTSIFFIAEKYNLKKLAVLIFSLYLTLLVGYNTYTQKEFVESWGYQKNFWSEIIKLVPDLKENTVILVEGNYQINKTRYIYSHHLWNDMILFEKLLKFPKEWKNPPKLFMVYGKWEENSIKIDDNKFQLKLPFPPKLLSLQDSNVVIIKYNKNNDMVRIDSSITIRDNKLYLKPKSESTLDTFKRKKLYEYLIKN